MKPMRRVVTGHSPAGLSIVTHNGPPAKSVALPQIPGTVFHEIWSTASTPATVGNGPDPTEGPLLLPPPKGGTRVRIVDIPPDTEDFLRNGAQRMHDAFAGIGDSSASTVRADSPHPLMHRTESVDYGVVLSGAMTLVLDDGVVELQQGDVVVQRGTNHAWANRSGETCRMMFVLIDGQYDDGVTPAR
ncbi:cupin domain-containing protein [Ramlibacter sp. G-1-2-2]|uniref:Cupin domain-containing protein n=1 Tax=Ramlibacter agri TaxID=2728837 RepID=A0A848HCB6_9BURK|nr:cupin domain-containing protein [Ramlibacter agri]NML47110.1 cupin domain-containing protein [Ramlibacter agri]